MEKGILKNILKNLGLFIFFALIGFFGVKLSQSLNFNVIQQYGQTIYPGTDFLVFAIPALCGLGSLYFLYRVIRLLFQLFRTGGKKAKIGCLLSLFIPLVLCTGAAILGEISSKNQEKINSPTVTAIANDLKVGKYQGGGDNSDYSITFTVTTSEINNSMEFELNSFQMVINKAGVQPCVYYQSINDYLVINAMGSFSYQKYDLKLNAEFKDGIPSAFNGTYSTQDCGSGSWFAQYTP